MGANGKGDDEGRFAVKLSLIFRPRLINTRAADYLYDYQQSPLIYYFHSTV